MKYLILLVLFAFSGCATMPPSEVDSLVYDSELSPIQVYELFTGQCGTESKNTGWANVAGNGFGADAKFDATSNSGVITYYHISFGTRSEPGSFWDRTFGQAVYISGVKNGSHIELHGETAAHLMRNKYKEIGELLKKKPVCST